MTLYQLRVFATVAKLRSFTLAGKQLSLRQPSVSLLVGGLSRELGVNLFDRLGTKIHLTRAGEHLLRRAEEILSKAEEVKERIDEIKGLKRGRIAVGGSALAGASFLPTVAHAFKAHHPGLEVVLKIHKGEFLERDLLEGRIEIALVNRIPDSTLLTAQLYGEEDIVVIAPLKHPLTARRAVPLDLIAEEPLIVQKKGRLVRDLMERAFVEKGLSFTGVLEVDAPLGAKDAIKNAVASGLGIGFVSRRYVAAEIEAGRLAVLNLQEPLPKIPIYLVFHKRRSDSPMIRAFIEFLQFGRAGINHATTRGKAL